jgi:D-alanine-D-alanine ligase
MTINKNQQTSPKKDESKVKTVDAEKEISKKIKVAVVFGGQSTEHSISCLSASSVLGKINRDIYEVSAIGITKTGNWIHVSDNPDHWKKKGRKMPEVKDPVLNRAFGGLLKSPSHKTVKVNLNPQNSGLNVDVVFPVLHGANGEDGTVQGLLEVLGVPYVGCEVFASAACQDKHFTKVIAKAAGVNVADWFTLKVPVIDSKSTSKKRKTSANSEANSKTKSKASPAKIGGKVIHPDFKLTPEQEAQLEELSSKWKKPIFVKPSRAGSSFGVSKVTNKSDFEKALLEAALVDTKVLVEEGIKGREIECAVLQTHTAPHASTLGEIKVTANKDSFYDFDAKYQDKTETIINPVMDKANKAALQQTALKVFDALDLRGVSRVDMFLCPSGKIYLNEVNTLPGFTSISMYPQLLINDGYEYSEILNLLIQNALESNSSSVSKKDSGDVKG